MRIPWQRAFVLRLLVLLVGMGQATSPAVASVADGVLAMDAGPGRGSAHVEDGRQTGCRVVHPHECVLCASLLVLAAPSRAELHGCEVAGDTGELATRGHREQPPRLRATLPRAPPTV